MGDGAAFPYKPLVRLYARQDGVFAEGRPVGGGSDCIAAEIRFAHGRISHGHLWTTLWLVALVVLLTGRLTPKRLLVAGLLLGSAFSVSMKTTVLAITVLVAGAGTWAFALQFRKTHLTENGPWQSYGASAAAILAGLAVVPAVILAFFASKHALRELYYCVIEHNLLPDTNSPLATLERFLTTAWLFVPVGAIAFAVRRMNRFQAALCENVSFS